MYTTLRVFGLLEAASGRNPVTTCAVPPQVPLDRQFGYNSSSPFEYRIQGPIAVPGLYHPQANWP